jgi:hypothetical protein
LNGGVEGADAEDVQLGWLVNASAVRFIIRIIFFFFVCFFFVSAIEIRKRAARGGKFKNFQTLPKEGRLESAFVSRV